MKTRKRIVTWMGYPDWLGDNPQKILEKGNRTVRLPDKMRIFAVRKVSYDDSMTPMYATPSLTEQRYTSLRQLLDEGKENDLLLLPILDLDHSLKTWNDEVSSKR